MTDWSSIESQYGPIVLRKPDKKKPTFAQSLFPSIGGLGGGVAGGALGGAVAGSAVLPGIGTAAGGLIGALLGGAAGGAAGKVALNRSLGEGTYHDVGKEAAIQGVLSAGPLRLLKGARAGATALRAGEELAAAEGGGRLVGALNAAGEKAAEPGLIGRLLGKGASTEGDVLKTSAGGKAKTLINSELARQYGTISKPVARATRPLETIEQLAGAGVVKPEDAERIARAITGSDGLLNKSVIKAVGNAKRVDTSGVDQIFRDALENNGVVDTDAKSLGSIVKAQIRRLNGGAAGSLEPNSHPNDVLDVMKSLEAKANDYLGRGGTSHLATSTDKAKANVLMTVRNELQDRLYQGAGADKNVASVLTPELRQQLVALAPSNKQWARYVDNTIMKSADIGALRSAQSPFVNISKIIDEGADNALTYGGRVGNTANSIKGQLVDKALGTARSKGAQVAAKLSNTLPDLKPWGLAEVGARTGAGGLAAALTRGGQTNEQPDTRSIDENTLKLASPLSLNSQGERTDAPDSWNNDPFDVSNVDSNIEAILKNGGKIKDVQDYVGLVEALNKIKNPTETKSKLSSTQQQRASAAQNALNDIGQIRSAVGSGKLGGLAALPGANSALGSRLLGNEDLNAALFNVADNILRARSGGAAPDAEVRRYVANFLPRPSDSQSAKLAKLARAERELQGYVSPEPADDLSQLLGAYQ